MKKRELYYEKIQINDIYSMQVDEENHEQVLIYRNNEVVEKFSLNRKIYTLFKVLQDHIKTDDYIIVEDNQAIIYGKEIHLYENIYMKVNADHICLTVDFYKKQKKEIKLIYLTKMTYMAQKLFYMMLIPNKLKENPNFYVTNVFKFLDMIEILKYEETVN